MLPSTESSPDDDEFLPDSHEVYDEADQASMIQMAENKQALEKVKARLAPETHPDFDGKNCLDCGEKIPKARLEMGRMRCVHCQGALEIKGRLYASKKPE